MKLSMTLGSNQFNAEGDDVAEMEVVSQSLDKWLEAQDCEQQHQIDEATKRLKASTDKVAARLEGV